MTNHWTDIANTDCALIMGSNPAENHPVAFRHLMAAKDGRGAKIVCVDPRFTRSASKADFHAAIRSGTDIAFLNGMIRWILEDMEANPSNYNMTYVSEYTNASFLVNPAFKGTADLDGLFSGYAGRLNETDVAKRKYDTASWQYQRDDTGVPKRDKTLKDPNSVFQLLKKHMSRYTPEKVSAITGCPQEAFLEVCKAFAATGKPDKAGTILYAMGTTQHTVGAQNIRAFGIIQMLLGNIGIAGGGINAMRGEANVQGSTDYTLLYHILPGYLSMFQNVDSSWAKYRERMDKAYFNKDPKSLNWWQNYPKYVVSLLKAWYGDAATKSNDFCYDLMPKIQAGKNYSHIPLFEAMQNGTIKGFMVWGQNPAVGGPNAEAQRKALDKLDWLLVTDLWHTETANYWKRPGVNPADIKTEVFLLPALASFEKEGSITNSGRWSQWRYKGAEGPAEAKDDLSMMNLLMLKLKELYRAGEPSSDAITKLAWDYGKDHADPHEVAKEINGYDLTTGKLMTSFANLKDDGTTSCGNWLYCASYTQAGNMAARRDNKDASGIGLFANWAWCWPVNRRIIYNRASVDLDGVPFDKSRKLVWWDAAEKKWMGDVIDGGGAPMNQGGHYPFIMRTEGVGRLFGAGMAEGPLPEHYEPWESPVANMMVKQQFNPMVTVFRPKEQGSPNKFPIVATTYRLCEHYQSGAMTRNLAWLTELMPEPFVEMSEELAAEKGITNGEKVIVETSRGQVRMVAIVTRRFKPFRIDGKAVHEVGMPWHWGFMGLSKGDSANSLTPYIGDANTTIPEYKAFLCNIRKAQG